jgi:hypothetical protein
MIIEIGGGILILGFIGWLIFRKKDSNQFA